MVLEQSRLENSLHITSNQYSAVKLLFQRIRHQSTRIRENIKSSSESSVNLRERIVFNRVPYNFRFSLVTYLLAESARTQQKSFNSTELSTIILFK